MPFQNESAGRLILAAGLVAAVLLGSFFLLNLPGPAVPEVSRKPASLSQWVRHPSIDALARASQVKDLAHRRAAIDAIMRHWATLQPLAATRACLQVPPQGRDAALASLFATFQSSPSRVLEAAQTLIGADPAHGRSYGYAAVRALAGGPTPEAAADFVETAAPAYRNDLVNEAYFRWAHASPEAATLHALTDVTSPVQTIAIDSALSGWATVDPSGLAQAATGFPAGKERDEAFRKAFRAWVISDSSAAETWLLDHPEAAQGAQRALSRR